MRVHITGSSSDPGDDLPFLRKIVDTLHKNGVSVVYNWVEAAHYVSDRKNKNSVHDWDDIVATNIDAISRADALIIEGTTHGFFQGFQAALALERRMPILFVARENINTRPISGIRSRLLTARHYDNAADLGKIVEKFIKDNAICNDNLQVSEKAYLYLKGEALISGRTESEVVDDLIRERLGK